MTTPFPSPTAPEALQFSLLGTIVTWDSFGRWLRIGERNLWVAPGVSAVGLTSGARVTARGHQEDLTARWIVTDIKLAGTINFKDAEAAQGNDIAAEVFSAGGVAAVFGVNVFVTITRRAGAEWDPIVDAVKAAAATHL